MNKYLFLLCILFFFSCTKENIVYSEYLDIDNGAWNKDNRAQFTIPITDTGSSYSIRLIVRNNEEYRWSNLYVFSNILFPNETIYRDTLNLILSDYKGEWTGEGIGNNYSNVFSFKNNIRFPETGIYTFSFEQGMRCEETDFTIKGISRIGLELVEYRTK